MISFGDGGENARTLSSQFEVPGDFQDTPKGIGSGVKIPWERGVAAVSKEGSGRLKSLTGWSKMSMLSQEGFT